MDWVNILTIALAAIGGSLGTFLVSFFKEKRSADLASDNQSAQIKTAQNEQALEVYKNVVETLERVMQNCEQRVLTLTEANTKLEKATNTLQDVCEFLKVECSSLTNHNTILQKLISDKQV